MNKIGKLLRKKISPIYLIAAAVTGSVASVVAVQQMGHIPATDRPMPLPESVPEKNSSYKFSRLEGYKYVHPLYLAEPSEESPVFSALKTEIEAAISKAKEDKTVTAASVYIKDFRNDEWMQLNKDEKYHPGSLFKLVTLTTYFRMAETVPALFDERWRMGAYTSTQQTYATSSLTVGKTYSVKELLYHMIVHNSTGATLLLQEHVDKDKFTQAFRDMGLPIPKQIPDTAYTIGPQQYARFVSTLYESHYLPLPSSEAAISLLCQTTFHEGIVSGLPQGTIVAHKHGEAGTPAGPELHETGIVYRNGQPYLITIMTRGTDIKRQAALIANISRLVWENRNRNN